MNLLTQAIVSNSEVTKNYKACREKADAFGKIFIFKNNQPDAVLFSIKEYQRLSSVIEFLKNSNEKEIEKLICDLLKKDNDENCIIDNQNSDIPQ